MRLTDFEKSLQDKAGTANKIQIQIARFLHRELPVLLAHRAVGLQTIPLMKNSKHVTEVCDWYKESFQEIREIPVPIDVESEKFFGKLVEGIYERHKNTLVTMARGAHEIKQQLNLDVNHFAEEREIQTNLDQFYKSRIALRTLIAHYLSLKAPQSDSNMVGIVNMHASPYDIALRAISDASYMCSRQHFDAPEVTIHGRTDLTFPYISDHIHYMLVELLKNSMRATVEFHGKPMVPWYICVELPPMFFSFLFVWRVILLLSCYIV